MALLLLVGCQADKKLADDKATESPTSSFSASSEDIATETEEATDEAATEDTEGVINEVNSKDTEIVEKVAGVQENCGNVSDNVEGNTADNSQSPQNSQSTNKPEQNTGGSGKSDESDQSLSQKSTEQSATHTSTEQETPEPTAPKQTEELKPNIDIDAQVSFAKSYAESIGLTLDSTATDCWDNPITVNAGKADVKGDIKSRLNRYKNTEGFTSVWVWAVKISDTEYELYIGYA